MPKNKERFKFARMKLSEAKAKVKAALLGIYEAGESEAIATWLLADLTGMDQGKNMEISSRELDQQEIQTLDKSINRLRQNEPLQYITGKSWFYGMELFVDRHVLIPRPETEELVDWIVRTVKAEGPAVWNSEKNKADKTTQLKILDIGTGSGCIALALKKALPLAEVWGCDLSEEALNVARRNGAALDIRVDFQGMDFLDEKQQHQLPSVDIIVSNPPYIPLSGKKDMHPNVVEYEPHLALFVPDQDPLVFYRAIAGFGKHRLHEGGSIYLEIHEDLAAAVMEIFRLEGYQQIQLKKDMQGKDRMLLVRR